MEDLEEYEKMIIEYMALKFTSEEETEEIVEIKKNLEKKKEYILRTNNKIMSLIFKLKYLGLI